MSNFFWKWVNQVSIYRPRSSGHLTSSKRSFGGFFIKKSRKYAISHDCAKWKMYQQQFRLLRAFHMTVRNQFLVFHLSCSQNNFLVHFARLCEFFACSCEIEKHSFELLFVFSSISLSWFHFNHLQINSKSQSKPIALLLSLCIWIIINIICLLQINSSLSSPIY